MALTLEKFYQEIGGAALDSAADLSGRLLVYAEIEEDVVSADMFYIESSGKVRFRFCADALRDILYDFWQFWREQVGNKEWRTLCYVIDEGRFAIDIQYDDQLNGEEGLSERRPRVIEKYFNGITVDYSRP
jgi:hypothetical protein